MNYKKQVGVLYEPLAIGGSVTLGNMRFICPKCLNKFQVSYRKDGDTETPLPKLCPFCGNELMEGEKRMTTQNEKKIMADGMKIEIEETFRRFIAINGDWVELQDCGDGKTFVSKDILFFSEFNEDGANVFEGSDIQIALNKWFDENAPEDIKANFDIDMLTMTEIFGETQEDGSEKFWPDEPYEQLPLFRDWRNRIKGEVNGNRPRWWWTKSPFSGNTNGACAVSDGNANISDVGNSGGVAMCFRRKAQ